jgi:phospholipase C
MKIASLLLLFALTTVAVQSPIKYIIVLMMENRSFDHLLGHLSKADSRIDGLNGA